MLSPVIGFCCHRRLQLRDYSLSQAQRPFQGARTTRLGRPRAIAANDLLGTSYQPSKVVDDSLVTPVVRALVASDLAVTLTGSLLAGQLQGVSTPELAGRPAAQSIYAMYAHGAAFAEVKVDPDLGQIRATRLVGAFAAGRNPCQSSLS